ncbi:MAG: HYR domain-containing protein [Saprospiraceae bacterium]|nr:HYR domain-containing protein [Saprospiraceae bacterium]
MEKQYYPLLNFLAIAGFFLSLSFDLNAQVGRFKNVKPGKLPLDCNTAPVIHCPADFIACPGANTTTDVTKLATAEPGSIECGTPMISYIETLVKNGSCPGSKLLRRVWTATDPNNTNLRSFCIQYISTLDTTAPIFLNCPKDTTILSNSKCTSSYYWTMPWVTDECGNFNVTSSHINGGEFPIGNHTVVITATDACGNSSSCSFHVEVLSNCCNLAPTIVCPADFNACPGSSTNPSVTGTAVARKASENCKEPIVFYIDKTTQTSSCSILIERTWYASDPENNLLSSSCIQIIRLIDNTAPKFTFCPSNIIVQSEDDCTAVVTWPNAIATDNCNQVSLISTIPSGFRFQLGSAAVVFIATDACGNTSKCEFLVTVEENCCKNPPVLNCPADYSACPSTSINPLTTGIAQALAGSPKCGQPIVSFTDDTLHFTNCFVSVNRTWKAVDPNHPNLFASCIQKIILEDKVSPVITFCPANITVQSGDDCTAEVSWPNPLATDQCGPVTITTSVPSGFRFQLGLAAVSVLATDVCGNTSHCEFLVTVEENCCKSNPIIQCPANFESCPGSLTDPTTTGTATAQAGSPKCNQPILNYTDEILQNTNCYTEINRTWTATDPKFSNLKTSCIQKIILRDTQPPSFIFCPPNITVQSDEDCSVNVNWNEPVASDACGRTTITTSILSGSKFQIGVTLVIVTATDECGNASSCQFSVTVEENCCKTIPSIQCPLNFSACPSSSTDPSITGMPVAFPGSPKCKTPLLSFTDEVIQNTDCYKEINRTWTATDPVFANLKASCIQKIILEDKQAPVFTFCPPNITVQSNDDCIAEVNWNNPIATDGCGSVNYTASIPNGSRLQLGITTIHIIATDVCGNTAECEFTITVEENCCNNPPVLFCPADYAACPGSSIDTSITGQASVDPFKPVCAPARLEYRDLILSSDPCRFIISRIWTATNPKNNRVSICTQTIVLEDTDAPLFTSCPPDLTIDPQYNCEAVVSWISPTATDLCIAPNITSNIPSGAVFSKGITRVVYTATDLCGNSATCWFFVTITDKCCDKNPILVCPGNFKGCPGIGLDPSVTGQATAVAGRPECEKPILSYTDRIISDGPCSGAIRVERTWRAADPYLSALRTECTQQIELVDNEAPRIFNLPPNITLNARGNCDVAVNWLLPETSDNCKLKSILSNYIPGTKFGNGERYVVYVATDFCGNATRDSFKITVIGTEIAITCPNDTTVVRSDPFINGAFVDWSIPKVQYCKPCVDKLAGFIYMGEHEGHRYFCSQGPSNWNAARISCELMGGKLAVINTDSENSFVSSKLNGQTAWIGATDQRIENKFEWIDNTPFQFTSWLPGQPNNGSGNENYIEMLPDGTWNDQNGNAEREFICEIPCFELQQIGGPLKGELMPCGNNKISYVASKDGKSDTCSFYINVDCDKESIYCKAKALNSAYMYNNRVEFAGIDTITGDNGGYHYFNKACGNIESGKTYPICVSPGFLSGSYKVYWKIWIDFNSDGFFDPVTEEVVYGYGTTTMCATLTMPASLPSKLTRMRVIMSYGNYPVSPCSSPLFGEVEDYCISMNGGTNFGPLDKSSFLSVKPIEFECAQNCEENKKRMQEQDEDILEFNTDLISFAVDLFPNPSSTNVSIKSKMGDIAEFEIYDNSGKMILHSDPVRTKNENSFSVKTWSNGMYTIIIRSKSAEQLIKRFIVNH